MKNLKKIIFPVALAVTMSLSAFLVACNDDPPPAGDAWRDQSIWLSKEALVPSKAAEIPEDVNYTVPSGSVHDPSVFHDPVSDAYYAYGTHFAVAKTFNLDVAFSNKDNGGWEQLAGDGNYKFLYGDSDFLHTTSGKRWPEAIRETVELVNPIHSTDSKGNDNTISTTWAPDVEYINGKYYMYYSLTKNFGSRESAIARVESDSPEGPFDNNVILVNSVGGSGLTPNCIDPELYYDKNGGLWMVYGSTYGGLYVLELNADGENVGLPKEEGYGKLVWRSGNNVEGPFIYYNASTDYYYLMTSYNDLTTTYNMHVARSQNPNGPFVGLDGKDVAVDGDGNQVSGNFRFLRSSGTISAFAALGHNSVVKDKDGKYYVICHVRRYADTAASASAGSVNGAHLLYVFQIYFNEQGWPVLSPTPYVGETRGTMTTEQVAKAYDVVLHRRPTGSGSNVTYVNSVSYTLTADGKVTGGAATADDTWTLKQNYYIEITIAGKTYKGVVAPGWDIYTTPANYKGVIVFTAVADDGASLWAIQQ